MNTNCPHRLLIWDSHISHVSLDVRYFGVENKIHLLTYPGHQTHKLQPLDVGIFSPLSTYYKQHLEKWVRANKGFAMSQTHFFQLLDLARRSALTKENIQSAFRTTGIHPLNRRKI
ncbi:CENP-B protein, partial [Ascobolus immersus RN42]